MDPNANGSNVVPSFEDRSCWNAKARGVFSGGIATYIKDGKWYMPDLSTSFVEYDINKENTNSIVISSVISTAGTSYSSYTLNRFYYDIKADKIYGDIRFEMSNERNFQELCSYENNSSTFNTTNVIVSTNISKFNTAVTYIGNEKIVTGEGIFGVYDNIIYALYVGYEENSSGSYNQIYSIVKHPLSSETGLANGAGTICATISIPNVPVQSGFANHLELFIVNDVPYALINPDTVVGHAYIINLITGVYKSIGVSYGGVKIYTGVYDNGICVVSEGTAGIYSQITIDSDGEINIYINNNSGGFRGGSIIYDPEVEKFYHINNGYMYTFDINNSNLYSSIKLDDDDPRNFINLTNTQDWLRSGVVLTSMYDTSTDMPGIYIFNSNIQPECLPNIQIENTNAFIKVKE